MHFLLPPVPRSRPILFPSTSAHIVLSALAVLSACYLTLTNPHPLMPRSQGNLPWTQTRKHFTVGCLYSPQVSSFTYYTLTVVCDVTFVWLLDHHGSPH